MERTQTQTAQTSVNLYDTHTCFSSMISLSDLALPLHHCKAGRTRTDTIGVGVDIGGTDISYNLCGQAVHGADTTKLLGRPPTCRRDAGDPLDK
jgi:hypothetical protein